MMKCRGGWRDQPDPTKSLSTCWGSDADREALELARAMTSEERQEYLAITARAQARLKGKAIEVEATTIEPGGPTGEELPLDE